MDTIRTTDACRAAKANIRTMLEAGASVQDAVAASPVPFHPSTVYRLRQRLATDPDTALQDHRHGHASKLQPDVVAWLQTYCQTHPKAPSWEVQAALQQHLQCSVSISQLNRVRAQLGLSSRPARREKKDSP